MIIIFQYKFHCLVVPVDIGRRTLLQEGMLISLDVSAISVETLNALCAETQSAKTFMRGRGTKVRGMRGLVM